MVPAHIGLSVLLCLPVTFLTAEEIQPQTNQAGTPQASTPDVPISSPAGVQTGGPGPALGLGSGVPSTLPSTPQSQTDHKFAVEAGPRGDSQSSSGPGLLGGEGQPDAEHAAADSAPLPDGGQPQSDDPSGLTGDTAAGILPPGHYYVPAGGGGVKTSGGGGVKTSGGLPEGADRGGATASNDTGKRSGRDHQTLTHVKVATLTLFMAMVAVAVTVMLVLSSLTRQRRRRRQYNRCQGLRDDCELRSNFQLVNHDERLGIRTSANYLM